MKKLFLSLLVILFLTSPRLIYAEENIVDVTVTPSPEAEQVIEVTNQVETTDTVANASDTASSSAEITTDTTINQTNNTTSETTIQGTANTGDNSSQNNIGTTEIHTGNSTAQVDITNNVNTNVAGSNYSVDQVNVTENNDKDIDLSNHPLQCLMPSNQLLEFLNANNITFQQFLSIIQTNNASILNDINLRALTGNNAASSIGDTSITTGDADVKVNISNIANTNLVGNCFYFAVINIYADQNGDIILPYEFSFLDTSNSPTSSALNTTINQSKSIDQQNNTDIQNNLNLGSNTGNNTGGHAITTGDATTQVTTIDRANQNIYGDNWIRLDINTFGSWSGALINWLFANNFIQLANASEKSISNQLATNLTNSTNSTISQSNNASIQNNITGLADTGNNSAQSNFIGQSSITTGNASVTVNLFNMLNTNIVGNNWYYFLLNIFGNFNGNIIFARPDLGIYGFTNKNIVYNGEDFWITLNYVSQGIIGAKNALARVQIPSMIDVLDVNGGGLLDGNSILWNLGYLDKGAVGTLSFRAKIKDDNTLTDLYRLPLSISTSMFESNMANNSFFIPFYIRSRTIGGSTNETSVSKDSISTSSFVSNISNPITSPSSSYKPPIKPIQLARTNPAKYTFQQPMLDIPHFRTYPITPVTPLQNLVLLSFLIILALARKLFL